MVPRPKIDIDSIMKEINRKKEEEEMNKANERKD
jgi:hypothetical protein